MKRKILLFASLLFVCVLLVGCEEKKKEEEPVTGGWSTILTDSKTAIGEEAMEAFNKSVTDSNKDYEPIALLGKQVVAGTNYMFLVKDSSYKVVVVYNDLEKNAHFTNINKFEITKYVNEDISDDAKDVVGGWEVSIPEKAGALDEKMQGYFDKAIEKVKGYKFTPIGIMGSQVVAGKNYAVLCYGKADKEDAKPGIYMLTMYVDLKDNSEIISTAYVDLATFNK